MHSEHKSSDRAEAVRFLKEHVIGKTLVAPHHTYRWDHDTMEYEHESQETCVNFAETAQGFRFDVIYAFKVKSYDLDPAGERILPGQDRSGARIFRYEFGERCSTQKLTGISRIISSNIETPSYEGLASLVTNVRVSDDGLIWHERLPGYTDVQIAGGRYKPGSWEMEVRLSLVGGKLQIESEGEGYDVDPVTLARTLSAEKLPSYVAREIDREGGTP